MLGLRFCARAFSSCGEWGPLLIAVRGPLTIAASLAAEQRLQTLRLSSCGSRAPLLRGMWDLPRPGHEPVSPALAGRFSTTAPPGKPQSLLFLWFVFCSRFLLSSYHEVYVKHLIDKTVFFLLIAIYLHLPIRFHSFTFPFLYFYVTNHDFLCCDFITKL